MRYAKARDCIAARSKVPIASLRVSGGGSQSDAAMQATADIFNLPAARPHPFETSGLGAAIAGAVGLGLHRDFPTASTMTRLGRVFTPDPATPRSTNDSILRLSPHVRSVGPLHRDLQDALNDSPFLIRFRGKGS